MVRRDLSERADLGPGGMVRWPQQALRLVRRSPAGDPRQSGEIGPVVGLILPVALAGWALLSHPAAPGGAAMAGLVIAGMVAWIVGALIARASPVVLGVGVALVIGIAIVGALPASLRGGPTAPPLGYANANAALMTAAVAGLLCAASATRSANRPWLVATAVGFTVASIVGGSRAGAVTCVLLLVLWPLLSLGRTWFWQLVSGLVLVTGFSVTVGLGLTQDPQQPPALLTGSLSEVRLSLWSDALELAKDHPILGVGPGNLARDSAIARSDPDLAWAHSAPLQTLAELGGIGLVLLGAVVGWMIWRLGRASVVLAVMALQPMVDYVLDFPLVVVLFALVFGGLTVSDVGGRQPRPG